MNCELRIANFGSRIGAVFVKSAIRNPQSRNSSQGGVVLIWTMLILMGLFGAASMIAIIMASSLRVAGSIDVGIPAFYAAESCLERAEYYITKQDTHLSRQAKVQRLNNPIQPQVPLLSGILTNGSTWARRPAECYETAGTPPDPCGKIFFSCIGSFKGTNAGLSILVD